MHQAYRSDSSFSTNSRPASELVMRKVHQRHLQAPSHAGPVGQSWIPSFKVYLKTVCAIMQASLLYAPYSAFTSFFILETGVTLIQN